MPSAWSEALFDFSYERLTGRLRGKEQWLRIEDLGPHVGCARLSLPFLAEPDTHLDVAPASLPSPALSEQMSCVCFQY